MLFVPGGQRPQSADASHRARMPASHTFSRVMLHPSARMSGSGHEAEKPRPSSAASEPVEVIRLTDPHASRAWPISAMGNVPANMGGKWATKMREMRASSSASSLGKHGGSRTTANSEKSFRSLRRASMALGFVDEASAQVMLAASGEVEGHGRDRTVSCEVDGQSRATSRAQPRIGREPRCCCQQSTAPHRLGDERLASTEAGGKEVAGANGIRISFDAKRLQAARERRLARSQSQPEAPQRAPLRAAAAGAGAVTSNACSATGAAGTASAAPAAVAVPGSRMGDLTLLATRCSGRLKSGFAQDRGSLSASAFDLDTAKRAADLAAIAAATAGKAHSNGSFFVVGGGDAISRREVSVQMRALVTWGASG